MADLISDETDARYWAQAGVKPGSKLDPRNPQDRELIKKWLEINKQVKAEDAAGNLKITASNPHVQANLAAAKAAHDEAAAHIDAASTTKDPQAVDDHHTAAAQAAHRARHHALEAAKVQPPTVTFITAKQISDDVGGKHAIVQETFRRQSLQTGQALRQLDPRNPDDAAAIQHWQQIYAQVVNEHAAVAAPPTGHDQLALQQARAAQEHVAAVHHHHHHREGGQIQSAVSPRTLRHYRHTALALARAAHGVFVMVIVGPDGTPHSQVFATRVELVAAYEEFSTARDQYRYVGAFDLAASPGAAVTEAVGTPAVEHVETPMPSEAAQAAAGTDGLVAAGAEGVESSRVGGFLSDNWKLLAGGAAAVGGLWWLFSRRSR